MHIGHSKDFASGIHNRAFEIGHSTMSISNLAMPIFRHRTNPLSIVSVPVVIPGSWGRLLECSASVLARTIHLCAMLVRVADLMRNGGSPSCE